MINLFTVLSITSIACVITDKLEDFRELDSIHQEVTCSRYGGMCTIGVDCPHLAEQVGLCPKQKMRGVECCHGMSVKETRCRKRGGACFKEDQRCSPTVTYTNATDCPKGTTCCILVK